MVSGLTLSDEMWIGPEHHFGVWDVDLDHLVPVLGDLLRDLYANPDLLRASLTAALEGLDGVADVAALESLIDEVVEAVVPVAEPRATQPWLELTRNEVGEVLAHHAAVALHGAHVVSRVEHKEVPQLPTRGMDLLGIIEEGNQIFLLAGEVKSSASEDSPPSSVGVGAGSMRGQLHGLIGNRKKVLQELNWSLKHAEAGDKLRISKALLLFSMSKLPIRLFPVLVRPAGAHKAADFGCFSDEHASFLPQHIRFCLLRLPCTLEEFADQIYSEARRAR